MQPMTEYCGIPVEWKLPPLKVGDEITFWYWNSDFSDYRGQRGKIISVRHLSANPIEKETKRKYNIVRGNVSYTIARNARRDYLAGRYKEYKKRPIVTVYNQRMSNVTFV